MHDFYKGEILLINKPYTWTSFQAVNKLKYGLKNHPSLVVDGKRVHLKIGHAGTLDPLATGLLVVCTGKNTKIISQIQEQQKEYTGTFFLGATTPCFDMEKEVDATFPTDHINEDMIHVAAKNFIGAQQQTPPIYSAVLVNGQRAYDIARKGETVELKSRPIEIYEFEITHVRMPEIDFRIVCSKGTYIRSIARDLGKALESGAYLKALCRTRIGNYKIENSLNPEEYINKINPEINLH